MSGCFDTGGANSGIKIRKGRNVVINGFSSHGSVRGLEIVNVQSGSISNCAITLADGPIGSSNHNAIELTDCGVVSVSDCTIDIRNVSAWGIRVRTDLNNQTYQNKH